MKAGYKIFIVSNVISFGLDIMSIKIPSVIENIWGIVVVAALLHAFFIAKSPVKHYSDNNVNGTSNNYSYPQERQQVSIPQQQRKTYNCPRCGRTTSSPGYCGSNCATGNGFGTFRM